MRLALSRRNERINKDEERWRDTYWGWLSPEAVLAFEVWRPVQSQIDVLNPFASNEDEREVVLRDTAVFKIMELMEIPEEQQLPVWEYVCIIHDAHWHGGRSYPDLCFHGKLSIVEREQCGLHFDRTLCRVLREADVRES